MEYEDLKFKIENKYIVRKKYKPTHPFHFDWQLFFTIAAFFVALSAAIFFIWASASIKPLINQNINHWIKESKGRRFEVDSFDYRKMNLTLEGVVFDHVRAKGIVRFEYPHFQPRHFDLYLPLAQFKFRFGFSSGLRLFVLLNGLEVHGGDLLPGVEEDRRRLEAVSEMTFQAVIPLDLLPFKWKGQIMRWASNFKKWIFADGYLSGTSLAGNATFMADGIETKVYFSSARESGGSTSLVGDQNDLRRIAQVIEPKVTNDDIEIASKHLLKTPRLLSIRTRAENKAEELYAKSDANFSYDTPRHVFWSYWLSNTFGSAFAIKVTDAHEVGDLQNTESEHEKDRRNNALGIEYAQRKLSEKETEKMVSTDSRISRD